MIIYLDSLDITLVKGEDFGLSVYAECSCGNSFYIETEDEQDNYSEW